MTAAEPLGNALRICVYCGSSHGSRSSYTAAARSLGEALSARRYDLVYGGGRVGLMGEVADTVLAGGRMVTGIITEHLVEREVMHPDVPDLVVVPDMQTRKREMFERSDAFIALPGGVGTMEELFEVLCWWYLGLHPKPVGILNVDGFYDGLLSYLQRAGDDGFIGKELLVVSDDVETLLDDLAAMIRTG
jgi:uncharacterized protein (TIGR00730 family)